MSDLNTSSELPQRRWLPRLRTNRRGVIGGVAVAVLAVGVAAGATGTKLAQRWQPQNVMLLQASPISAMRDDSAVALKGSVAESFGHAFILQDGSGRALVDLGPRAGVNAVAKDEAVTVQGRFDQGIVHAQILVHADGRSEAFGPPGRPPRPDRGPPDRSGPRADRGPPPPPPANDRGPEDAPPPPSR